MNTMNTMDAYRLSPRFIINGWIRANGRAPSAAVFAAAKAAAVAPENRSAHMAIINRGGPRATAESIALHHAIGAAISA